MNRTQLGLAAWGLGLLVLTACSSKSPEAWRRVPAGQSPDAMGIIVDGGSVEEMKELEAQGATIREVYGKAGIYEVFDLDKSEIQKSVGPDAQVFENEYIPLQLNLRPTPRPQHPDCEDVFATPEFGFVSQPPQIAGPRRSPVTIQRNGQKVQIGVAGPGIGKIRYKLGIVSAPSTSSHNPANMTGPAPMTIDKPIEFIPDDMGAYAVGLLVNLPDGSFCADRIDFAVTDNAPFMGHGSPMGIDVAKKLQSFSHLQLIGAEQSWPHTQGKGVTIAIIDTGVNYNHPALRFNIATNSRETPGNNRDDDGNGLVDDSYGYDFLNNDPYPFDDFMHGTHVAGLASSVAGVAPQARVLPIKVMGPFGGNAGSLYGAIRYAVDSGANIINISFGSELPSQNIQSVISYAESKGVLVVVATGNDRIDIDKRPAYPSNYPNENILTVAATDHSGNIAGYSNYGATNVDIAAPGGTPENGLLSTFYANTKNAANPKIALWTQSFGTSMAAPVVSGVAALAWSLNPNLNAIQVKQLLMERGTNRPDYQGRIRSSKLIDARNLRLNGSAPAARVL